MADARSLVLGELALRSGLVTGPQLRELIARQERAPGRRLGALMVDEGYASHEQLDALLAVQRRALGELSDRGNPPFGVLAVERGWAEPDAVADCLRMQRALEDQGLHVRIGQLLLGRGLITLERFWAIRREQEPGPAMCARCEGDLSEPRFTRTQVLCPGCGAEIDRIDPL